MTLLMKEKISFPTSHSGSALYCFVRLELQIANTDIHRLYPTQHTRKFLLR